MTILRYLVIAFVFVVSLNLTRTVLEIESAASIKIYTIIVMFLTAIALMAIASWARKK